MILKAIARGKKCQQKSWPLAAGTVLSAAAIWVATSSLPIAVCACATCAGLLTWAPIIRKEWRKYQAGRALARWLAAVKSAEHACGKTDFDGIILTSYSRSELARYKRRGEVLRANRGQP